MAHRAEVISQDVRAVFSSYQPQIRANLLICRDLLFEVAEQNDEIGPILETLKWGQASYLTPRTRSGSTVRLAATKSGNQAAIFVNCNTSLIEQFSTHYPETFSYSGNRALILPVSITDLQPQISHCLALALTYHFRKKTAKLA
ncbi:MAG: DUF1801 domain-containing protein [Rhizobiaceae bacterium]